MKQLTYIFLLLFSMNMTFAQNPGTKVFDFFVVLEADETSDFSIDSTYMFRPGFDTTSTIVVNFKIDTINEVDSVFLNIGSTNGALDGEELKFKVINNSGRYSLDDGNKTHPFTGHSAGLLLNVTYSEVLKYLFYEVWAKDKNGISTPVIKTTL